MAAVQPEPWLWALITNNNNNPQTIVSVRNSHFSFVQKTRRDYPEDNAFT
jgi:hypothetical protein